MGDFDLAAINDRGVYAICYDDGTATARDFVAEILAEGGAVKRLPRQEAVDQYTAYLNATWPEFAALSGSARPTPQAIAEREGVTTARPLSRGGRG